ncbi:fimbrial protein [Cronobacter sakazakii]|uniref:fimbrial protein n=1 Tax=Cronobacter sakazakii TaxID=28141 RepID=UPI000BEABDE4|nr:fimbrial protein [Cronobacter sakazakii]EKK5219891.1 fimbrial protein [Cronobacter sakazakii]ELY3793438.1 fimbrial protein [Cronobacter sakazakii]ELY3828360.1 fimbrial protein [Cronobacter sakazakii]ELY4144555.1 fimbrial protein [Cronobacter sakazakii]MDT3610128.1 fimbrial protein [Cronobacter sakazakii]
MSNSLRLSALLLLAITSALYIKAALADDFSANVTVRVTINTAPCEINNNQNIDVDFGNSVITTDVMAGTVQKTVNYTLECSNADADKLLKMHIAGIGAEFNNDLLQTSIPELAIKIKADGTDYALNKDLALASGNIKPELVAVLVGKPGSRLPTGGFTAGATMTVDYQ